MDQKQKYPFTLTCTAEEYHARPEVGSSSLRLLMEKSPAHFLYNRQHPSESTPSQKLGTMIHTAILEPIHFFDNAVIEKKFSGEGMRAKTEQWHLENEGKIILKRDQADMIAGILGSLDKHAHAKALLSEGAAEKSLFWMDAKTGIECKARPDFFREGHIIVDVKTTSDASFKGFQHSIATYGYHVQAAMYLDAATAVHGKQFDQFVVVAIEKEPPYAVNCFLLDQSTIDEGRAIYFNALQVLKKCMVENNYPAYPDRINDISIPTWAFTRGE